MSLTRVILDLNLTDEQLLSLRSQLDDAAVGAGPGFDIDAPSATSLWPEASVPFGSKRERTKSQLILQAPADGIMRYVMRVGQAPGEFLVQLQSNIFATHAGFGLRCYLAGTPEVDRGPFLPSSHVLVGDTFEEGSLIGGGDPGPGNGRVAVPENSTVVLETRVARVPTQFKLEYIGQPFIR